MESHPNAWMIKQFSVMIKQDTIRFDYPIQREADQWNLHQKSLFIHSCLAKFPIPPLYFLRYKEERPTSKQPVPVREVLDGKQRLTVSESFINNGFTLTKDTPNVFVEGIEYEIGGKTFEELEEPVQLELLGRSLTAYTIEMDSTTEEEIEEMFYRMNNSSALTVHQKAKALAGVSFSRLLNDVSGHVTIVDLSNFSKDQRKKNIPQAVIMQVMMLLEEFEFKKLSSPELTRYVKTIKADFDNKVKTLEKVEQALEYLSQVFSKKEMFLLKPSNFPMTVSLAYYAYTEKIEYDTFYMWSTNFVDACLDNDNSTAIATDYMNYLGKSTSDKVKVYGRINSMKEHFEKYLEMLQKA